MTPLFGHRAAETAFLSALASGHLHHAWLLAGPEGVGKASFARLAALRMLAQASDPSLPAGMSVADDQPVAKLFRAGTHPDYRELRRLPKDPDKPDQDLARSIPIAQVRALMPMLASTPSLSSRRVIVIDAADDLERPGASNALLKSLEEPPSGTVFLLVSHAPGRLLPTIRSRCHLLRFASLGEADMHRALTAAAPELPGDELDALVRAGGGSPGRALRYAGLDLTRIDADLAEIARDGDRDNRRRLALVRSLGAKAAQPRYEAFLDRATSFVAQASALRHGEELRTALDAHDEARRLAILARANSLDAQATVFEMAGIVARLSG